MIRLPVFILMWVLFLAIKLPTAILGLFVVPLLYRYRTTEYNSLPVWTRPWANPEDHTGQMHAYQKTSLPEWWFIREGDGFWSFFKYHALRNPANGLRSFELLDLDIEQQRVRYCTKRYLAYYEPWFTRPLDKSPQNYGYIAYQGFKAGVKFVHHWNAERHFVFKFGWRIEPRHAHAEDDGLLQDDAGFASKLLVWREG